MQQRYLASQCDGVWDRAYALENDGRSKTAQMCAFRVMELSNQIAAGRITQEGILDLLDVVQRDLLTI